MSRLGFGVQTYASRRPPFVSGRWYPACQVANAAAGGAVGANTIRLMPFTLDQPMTVAALGARVTTLAAGNCQLAIYANDPTTGRPTGTALASTANISTAAAQAVSANLSSNVSLPAGDYWMAVNADNATVVFQALGQSQTIQGYLQGSATLANLTSGAAVFSLNWNIAQTFGTWPNLTGQALTETIGLQHALLFLKAA